MRLPIVPLFRSRRAVLNGGLLLSVAYDLTCFVDVLNFIMRECVNEAVVSAIIPISSSSVEWWSSFVCCLRLDLFHAVF